MTEAGSVELTGVSLALPASAPDAQPHCILDNISIRFAPGSSTALLGRSGSGKTTLLRTINALVRPTTGTVLVNGRDILRLRERELRAIRRHIGYVIQETGLFPHMTIGRNVALPLEIGGKPKKDKDVRATELLDMVGLDPSAFSHRYPHELSGGQRQRAGLARALAARPSILLLDEPFGALDPLTRTEMQALLKSLLAEVKTTAIFVTHDLQEAMYLADKIAFVSKGQVALALSPAEIGASSEPLVAAYRSAAEGLHRTEERFQDQLHRGLF
ncbi:MAG: ATP-binding cassette domain-containing protein [Acidobacteria bacterium]|nr:ATP-binding cassette domain-containing protein [Acidobacteriota bacterium]